MYDVDDNMSGSVPTPCRESAFFKALPAAALAEFKPLLAASSYSAGASLFNEAEPTRGVYVVLEGEVKLSINNSGGRRLTFQMAKPGELLGLWGLFSGGAYEMNADTVCEAKVAYIPRAVFMQFLSGHHDAYFSVAKEIDRSFSLACEQLRTAGLATPTSKRLPRLLLVWSDESEKKAEGGGCRLPMTREEIGALAGASREIVVRTVSVFKNQKLAARHGCTITTLSTDALETYEGD